MPARHSPELTNETGSKAREGWTTEAYSKYVEESPAEPYGGVGASGGRVTDAKIFKLFPQSAGVARIPCPASIGMAKLDSNRTRESRAAAA